MSFADGIIQSQNAYDAALNRPSTGVPFSAKAKSSNDAAEPAEKREVTKRKSAAASEKAARIVKAAAPKERKTQTLTMRVKPSELKAWQEYASEQGVTLSALIQATMNDLVSE